MTISFPRFIVHCARRHLLRDWRNWTYKDNDICAYCNGRLVLALPEIIGLVP